MSKTLKALKDIAVKVTGKKLAQIKGDTIDEVIAFMNANLNITANGLVLTDANGVVYDVKVNTSGVLTATARG